MKKQSKVQVWSWRNAISFGLVKIHRGQYHLLALQVGGKSNRGRERKL
jgi:hypothetical protein